MLLCQLFKKWKTQSNVLICKVVKFITAVLFQLKCEYFGQSLNGVDCMCRQFARRLTRA